jgi:hypothetical protein
LCSVSVARKVCCHHPHHITQNAVLSVRKLEAALDVEVCAIEVTGILKKCSTEFISLFFENEKRSGGGPIQEMEFDENSGVAVITFENADSEI